MLTTAYPRWADDPSGDFVAKLAWYLTREQNIEVVVLAPAAMFSFISAVQFTLFAMWFNMKSNKDLK
jgi:uncharacterized protein (DUF2164 family)